MGHLTRTLICYTLLPWWLQSSQTWIFVIFQVVGSGSSLSFFLTSQSAGVYTCKVTKVSVCLTSHVCIWRVSISMWLLDSILIIILLDSPLSLSYLLISKELIKRKLNISPSRPLRRVSRAWAARPQWQCGDLRGSWRGGRCSGAVQGRLYTSCVRPLPCPGYRHSSGSSRWIIQSV